MTIEDVISRFNTTPFLFIGSGITRRYLNLPDWKALLEHFAKVIDNDDFIYSAYENKAKVLDCKAGILPKIAELIQVDYDERWYRDKSIRTVNEEVLEQIKNEGLSPFKAEIASYIRQSSVINSDYLEEIEKLTRISEKSISGIITTNYDSFLEEHFVGFTKYVGQTQLIFSAIQGIAEIYKIHGSIENPGSIVINEADYMKFDENSAYLAAKLMTIFMEYKLNQLKNNLSEEFRLEGIAGVVWEEERDIFITSVIQISQEQCNNKCHIDVKNENIMEDIELTDRGYYIKKSEQKAGKDIRYCVACYQNHGKLYPFTQGSLRRDLFCSNCRSHISR